MKRFKIPPLPEPPSNHQLVCVKYILNLNASWLSKQEFQGLTFFVLKPPTQHYFPVLPFAWKVFCKSLTSKSSSPWNTTNVFPKTGVFKSSNVKIQQTTSTPPVLSGFLVFRPSLNNFPWLPNIRPLPKSPRGHLSNHQRSPSQEPDSVDQKLETKFMGSFRLEKKK